MIEQTSTNNILKKKNVINYTLSLLNKIYLFSSLNWDEGVYVYVHMASVAKRGINKKNRLFRKKNISYKLFHCELCKKMK